MVVSAISIVAVILCIIALGILLARLGWLGEKESALLAKLTTKVALPLMVVSNMYKYFTHDSLVQNASGIAVSMLSIAGLILLGLPVARLARVPANRRGVFISMFAFSNSVFIGVPVSTALFGEEAVGFALLYYIANTSIFWSVANSMIISDAKGKFDVIATIRTQPRAFFARVLPLPLIAFLVCAVLIYLRIPLPEFVLDAAGYVGNMVTPLSLIYTGAVLMRMIRMGRFQWHWDYIVVVLGRFFLAPAAILGISLLFPTIPMLMRSALIVQASMPVMANIAIVAGSEGADSGYAAGGMVLSTILTAAFLPLLMMAMEAGWF